MEGEEQEQEQEETRGRRQQLSTRSSPLRGRCGKDKLNTSTSARMIMRSAPLSDELRCHSTARDVPAETTINQTRSPRDADASLFLSPFSPEQPRLASFGARYATGAAVEVTGPRGLRDTRDLNLKLQECSIFDV